MGLHFQRDIKRMFRFELSTFAAFIILFLLTACVVAAGSDTYHHKDRMLATADSRSIEGIWSVTANDVPGKLEFFWTGRGWSGRIQFDLHEPGEALANIFFDPRTGELQFIRPRYNQTYSGTFLGNQISGSFTEAGRSFPWLARRESVGDLRDIRGLWYITANDVPGKLEFFWTGRDWSGRIDFDIHEPGEALANIFFDPRTGQLQFIRPRYNQTYSGTLSGNQISGSFTEAGRSFPWLARRESVGDLRDIRGLWYITANDVPGKLEFFWTGRRWTGRIQFDLNEPGEPLANILFDPRRGELQFIRPRYSQTYSGTLSGNQLSGTFTEGGRGFPWVARRRW